MNETACFLGQVAFQVISAKEPVYFLEQGKPIARIAVLFSSKYEPVIAVKTDTFFYVRWMVDMRRLNGMDYAFRAMEHFLYPNTLIFDGVFALRMNNREAIVAFMNGDLTEAK